MTTATIHVSDDYATVTVTPPNCDRRANEWQAAGFQWDTERSCWRTPPGMAHPDDGVLCEFIWWGLRAQQVCRACGWDWRGDEDGHGQRELVRQGVLL